MRRMRLLARIGEDNYTSTALDKLLHGNDRLNFRVSVAIR